MLARIGFQKFHLNLAILFLLLFVYVSSKPDCHKIKIYFKRGLDLFGKQQFPFFSLHSYLTVFLTLQEPLRVNEYESMKGLNISSQNSVFFSEIANFNPLLTH